MCESTSVNDEECLLQVRVLDSDDVNEVLKHFDQNLFYLYR